MIEGINLRYIVNIFINITIYPLYNNKINKILKRRAQPGMVVHTCNPMAQEIEAGDHEFNPGRVT
jgi:hypothetical protein